MRPSRLVVLGNAGLDITHELDALPRPGETVIARRITRDLGGKGLNQAVAAARAGAPVRLVAPVGTDAVADRIRTALAAEGIGDDLIARQGASDTAIILVDRNGENVIVSDTGQVEALHFDEVKEKLVLSPADLLLMQGNLSETTTRAALAHARACGAIVALNAAPLRNWLIGTEADILIANRLEAALWVGGHDDDPPEKLVARIAAPVAIVTLGPQGAILKEGLRLIRRAAPPACAADTTGAGDVLAGVFCAEWIAGAPPEDALALAVAAASRQVTRKGTVSAMPSRDDIARLRPQPR